MSAYTRQAPRPSSAFVPTDGDRPRPSKAPHIAHTYTLPQSDQKIERLPPLEVVESSNDHGIETMRIADKEDASFVCGKGGTTIKRIGSVSGCRVSFRTQGMLLEVEGSSVERKQALLYAKFMIAQRKAKNDPVPLEQRDVVDYCTVMDIPREAMAFLLGSRGTTLRKMEQENNVIMFVGDVWALEKREDVESLCIFGGRSGRRSAQLEVMSNVESLVPDYYISRWRATGETFEQDSDRHGDWDTATMELSDSEIRFLVGCGGRTKRSICKASECILHYVGSVVFLAGTAKARCRGEDYVGLLLGQILEGSSQHVEMLFSEPRDDRSLVQIPLQDVAYVTGKGRETLAKIEDDYGVIMMFLQSVVPLSDGATTDMLAIFGPLRARTYAELEVMASAEHNDPGLFTRGCHDHSCTDEGFATDCITFRDKKTVGYILGKAGSTRKRLSRASGAHLQFVGNVLHIAGNLDERIRGRDYLDYHLKVEQGQENNRIDVSGRSDVSSVSTHGARFLGSELWNIEDETGTFCLVALDETGAQKFFIFGKDKGNPDHGGRAKAEKMAFALFRDKQRRPCNGGHRAGRSRTPPRARQQQEQRRPGHRNGRSRTPSGRQAGRRQPSSWGNQQYWRGRSTW